MESTENSNKGIKVLAGVLAIAVLAGAYLYFQPNKDNLPPELKVDAETTQGFLKAQYLDFLTPTAADETKFDSNVSYWKNAKVTPTPLQRTATNKGQHYLYWDGELGSVGTFKDLVESVNPTKAEMLFAAKWDATNRYFNTTPHNYYKKVDSDGNILTKVLDAPEFDDIEMQKSEGVVFASKESTEVYGFKDGNTFAKSEYGICDAVDVKENGWHLFAAHTASLDQLFKDCYEGEILDAYEQTSVDPVSFKRVVDLSKSVKYSMLWVNKGTAVSTWKPSDNTSTERGDHVYNLLGDKLTMQFNDDTQGVYQIKLEPSSLDLVRNTDDEDDTFIEIYTETEDYVGKFEFNADTKKFEVNIKSSLEGKYTALLGDYSDKGLSKTTILIGEVQQLAMAALKSKTVTGKAVNMVVALPMGVEAKYVREMHLVVHEGEILGVGTDTESSFADPAVLDYTENYEKEKPVTTNADVKVTYSNTNTGVTIDVTGLNYETTYTFQVVFTVADKNESKLIMKESKPLNVVAITESTPDHTYKIDGDTLEVAFNDGSNGKYPLYTYPVDAVLKVESTDKDNYVAVYTADNKLIANMHFGEDKKFWALKNPFGDYDNYIFNLGDYTSAGLAKNTITILGYEEMAAAEIKGLSGDGFVQALNMQIDPPKGVDKKTLSDMELYVYEGTKGKEYLEKAPLYTVEVDYANKKMVAVNKDTTAKNGDKFQIKFTDGGNLGVLISDLKHDTTYTIGVKFYAKSPDEKKLIVNESSFVVANAKTAVDPAIAAKKIADENAKLALIDHKYEVLDNGNWVKITSNLGPIYEFEVIKSPSNLSISADIGGNGHEQDDAYIGIYTAGGKYIGYFEIEKNSEEFKYEVIHELVDQYSIKLTDKKITITGPAAADNTAADKAAEKAAAAAIKAAENSTFTSGDKVLVLKDPTELRWYPGTVKVAKDDVYTVKLDSSGLFQQGATLDNVALASLNTMKHPANPAVGDPVISVKKASSFFKTTTLGYYSAKITAVYEINGKKRVDVEFTDGSDNKGYYNSAFQTQQGNYTITPDDLYEQDLTVI